MQEGRRLGPSEQPRELDLPSGRRQQIVAAHDQRDPLLEIIDGRRELIGPVAFAIANEQIAALLVWPLLLRSVAEIDESLDRWLESHANAEARPLDQSAIAAGAGITELVRWCGSFRPADATLKGSRHIVRWGGAFLAPPPA